MSLYTVGSVPYTNAIPLVAMFERRVEGQPQIVEVLYDVPSRLPEMLVSKKADAILVSSVDALQMPNRRMADGVCIGSHGPVKSVRLFSKVPPKQIKTLAWDASSMTSNRLAMILLAERFGVKPETKHMPPDQDEMLSACDACVLIGDIGMRAPSEGLHVLDLGEEWKHLTGKPFVWAAWIGEVRLTPQLAMLLHTASQNYQAGRDLSAGTFADRMGRLLMPRWYASLEDEAVKAYIERRRQDLLNLAQPISGWPRDVLADYFFNVMVYDMGESSLAGLREFQRLLLKHGFEDCRHFPEIVEPSIKGLEDQLRSVNGTQ